MDSSQLFLVGMILGLIVEPIVFSLLWLWTDMPGYNAFPRQEQTWMLLGTSTLTLLLYYGLGAVGAWVPHVARYQHALTVFLALIVINPAVRSWRWRKMQARKQQAQADNGTIR